MNPTPQSRHRAAARGLAAALIVAGVTAPAAARADVLDWLRLGAGAGYQTLDLRTFDAGDDELSAGVLPTTGAGPEAHVEVGARLLFLSAAVRARVAQLDARSDAYGDDRLQLWSLGAELGLVGRIGPVEPALALAGGYSSFGSLGDAMAGLERGFDVDGAHLGLTARLALALSPRWTLGLRGHGEALFMARDGKPLAELAEPQRVGTLNELEARILEADGASVGLAYGLAGDVVLAF